MTETISGQRIAFLATDGVEQAELEQPWEAVQRAGGTPVLVSLTGGEITAMQQDWEHGDSFHVDVTLAEASVGDYDGLVLPGGTLSSDALRVDAAAQAFARAFVEAHKPVAAICHAPWLLIEAGVVDGRELTSYASLRTDLTNAGAQWRDAAVVVDGDLTTSRDPGDLPVFCATLVDRLAAA